MTKARLSARDALIEAAGEYCEIRRRTAALPYNAKCDDFAADFERLLRTEEELMFRWTMLQRQQQGHARGRVKQPQGT
jgi:hypothetical protein